VHLVGFIIRNNL